MLKQAIPVSKETVEILVIGYYMCVGIMKYLVPVNTDNFRGV